MLPRVAGSAMRAPRVGGQPRGGGTAGPVAGWEWTETGWGSACVGDAGWSRATTVTGVASTVAHDGIDPQSLAKRLAPHPSSEAGAPSCGAFASAIAPVRAPVSADPCARHEPRSPSSVSCRNRRPSRRAERRRSTRRGFETGWPATANGRHRSRSYARGDRTPSGFVPRSCAGTPDPRSLERLSSGIERPHHPAWITSTTTTRTLAMRRRHRRRSHRRAWHRRTRTPARPRTRVTTSTPVIPWRCSGTGSGSRSS